MADAPYRDETPRLERRIEELEDELAGARAEIRALRGDGGAAPRAPRAGLLGVPLDLSLETRLDGEVTDAAHEDLLDAARAWAAGSGHGASVGTAFRWSLDDVQAGRHVEVAVRPADGRTAIRIDERLGRLAGNVVGGIVGGLGLSGVVGIVMAGILGRGQSLAAALVVAAVWLALTVVLARGVLVGMAGRRRGKARQLLQQLRAVCERHVAVTAERVRIAGGDVDGSVVEAEREALAEETRGTGRRARRRTVD